MISDPKRTGTPAGALMSVVRPVILSSARNTARRLTPCASGFAPASGDGGDGGTGAVAGLDFGGEILPRALCAANAGLAISKSTMTAALIICRPAPAQVHSHRWCSG